MKDTVLGKMELLGEDEVDGEGVVVREKEAQKLVRNLKGKGEEFKGYFECDAREFGQVKPILEKVGALSG